jgi:transcriptional regulator of acetoin/glycerol metabolism
MRAPDGRRGLVAGVSLPAVAPEPLAIPEPTAEPLEEPVVDPRVAKRLRESDLDLIRTTLQACGGNVSEAAKRLGVSRGLIYRRLRA